MPRQAVSVRLLIPLAAASFFAFISWIIWLADTGNPRQELSAFFACRVIFMMTNRTVHVLIKYR